MQYYKKQYEWLLELNDDELSQKVIDRNDVQNALFELLRLVDDVMNLPTLFNPQVNVGDTVYVVSKRYYKKEVIKCKVTRMQYKKKFSFTVAGKYENGNYYNANFTEKSIGKNVFLDKEEVEKQIKL